MSLLVTAGPTHEPIDRVRYLANRSSGRMGIAITEAALDRELPVTLLLGPTPLTPPVHSQLTVRRFQTTADLQELLAECWPAHDVLIMAAAVADYRPARVGPAKHPRGVGAWTIELEPTPDLLVAAAAAARPGQVTVGFALEPAERLLASARRKLAAKGVDAIVANPLETIGGESVAATLVLRDGRELKSPQGECTKRVFAEWLLDQMLRDKAPSGPGA